LIAAASRGHVPVARLLLQSRADPECYTKYKQTAVMRAADNGKTDVLRLLIESKASTEAPDPTGESALMLAARKGHRDAVKVLVDAGAKDDTKIDHHHGEVYHIGHIKPTDKLSLHLVIDWFVPNRHRYTQQRQAVMQIY
jgi:ankyrin repeat protein